VARDRVRFHLDPTRSTAAIFLADAEHGAIAGHTIVRIERDDSGQPFGLFSTTYVEPAARRAGVARLLLLRGEQWMGERGMSLAATDTSETNTKLIRLYEGHGYAIVVRDGGMVRLAKTLSARDAGG
jgi:GNAT superfamily N-acetyltransferase